MKRVARLSLLGLAAVCPWASGCGQSVTIRATRIATLEPNPAHPATIARKSLMAVAEKLSDFYHQLQATTQDESGLFTKRIERLAAIRAELDQPGSYSSLRLIDLELRALELRMDAKSLANMTANTETLVNPRAAEEHQKRIGQLLEQNQAGLDAAAKVLEGAEKEIQRLHYGGFTDNTVHRINAGSREYADINPKARGMLFSEVRVKAIGETGVLIVQETPAHFELSAMRADPSEVLRNVMIVTNKILRVMLAFMQQAGGPAGAVAGAVAPSAPSSGTSPAAPPDAGGSSGETGDAVSNMAAALLSDPQLMSAVTKARAGQPLTPEETAALAGRLQPIIEALTKGK